MPTCRDDLKRQLAAKIEAAVAFEWATEPPTPPTPNDEAAIKKVVERLRHQYEV